MEKPSNNHSGTSGSINRLPLRPATPHMNPALPLHTVDEAGVIMRMKAKTVRKLIAYRMLEAVRMGVGNKRARYLISQAAIEKYLASRTQPAEL